jgi:hypothetical protein
MSHSCLAMPRRKPLRFAPSLALANAALVLLSGRAYAAVLEPVTVSAHIIPAPSALAISSRRTRTVVLEPITISAPLISGPVLRTVGCSSATNASIQQRTSISPRVALERRSAHEL